MNFPTIIVSGWGYLLKQILGYKMLPGANKLAGVTNRWQVSDSGPRLIDGRWVTAQTTDYD